MITGGSLAETKIKWFTLCHRKYSQSGKRKVAVNATVFRPTFQSCAARMSLWLCSSLYFLWHGIQWLCHALSLYTMDYYSSDSLWKIWLVESIQSIHNSLWTWHDKISAADIAFIMSSSTSAWLLSPLECSSQKRNGWTLRFCFWGWIMSNNCGERFQKYK